MAAKKGHHAIPSDEELCRQLVRRLTELRRSMVKLEKRCAPRVGDISPAYRASASNLLHYIAMRSHDMRPVQKRLAALGLSSLGRSEPAVLATVNNVLHLLYALSRHEDTSARKFEAPIRPDDGRHLLQAHTEALLGKRPAHRFVRVMVTMPTEASDNYELVRALVQRGMNCMRVNCAHDTRAHWERMIANLRRANKELGTSCRVLMDLAGPKLRTGPIEPGAAVLKWRPRRDNYGRVRAPVRLLLAPTRPTPPAANSCDVLLTFPRGWLEHLSPGDTVRFVDARAARRTLVITARDGDCLRAEARQTAYVTPNTSFMLPARRKLPVSRGRIGAACATNVPSLPQTITLARGDTLVLTRSLTPGWPAEVDEHGVVRRVAHIGCTMPEVFASVRAGEPIWFDDGRIGGVIRQVRAKEIIIEIVHARPKGERLAAEKGINLPESDLAVSAFTAKDAQDLAFAAKHANLVSQSFVRTEPDVRRVQRAMKRVGGNQLGLVLKIETRRAFEMLPELLLAAMRSPAVGIMIARGDLAVECGFERLAEVQEEILWVCEAAHMPVIWATQVLENLAKDGLPSRAEITDAAMGERAECVMLNKGPHIIDAIELLNGILRRMEMHQHKKRSMMRRLHWWTRIKNHIKHW